MLFWTRQKCYEEAQKYQSRMDFKDGCNGAYWSSHKHGWLNDVCGHMLQRRSPNGYWSKDRCREDAARYSAIKEYKNGSYLSYSAAKRNGWIPEICKHMKKTGNRYNKCVYAYEFTDGSVYVGLTFNIENRQRRRDSDPADQVTKHARKTGLVPVRKQLTIYLPVDEAIKQEENFVEQYKKNGWKILNVAKTGSIGGNTVIWTYGLCKDVASRYTLRTRFKKDYAGAYNAAYTKGWIDDICSHMKKAYHPVGYWTYNACREESTKYGKSSEFKRFCQYGWDISRKNGWLSEFYRAI